MSFSYAKSATYRGTTLTVDLVQTEGNRGVITSCLDGGTDAVTDLAGAISFLVSSAPGTFPGTNIPKRGMSVESTNGKHFTSKVFYQFTPFSGPGSGGISERAKFTAGMISVPWFHTEYTSAGVAAFDSSGAPDGIINGTNSPAGATGPYPLGAGEQAKAYGRRVPVISVEVPFNLATNPINMVADLIETTNSDSVTFGGKVYVANRIRFDGMWCTWVQPSAGATRYIGGYQFTTRRDGWVKEAAVPEGATTGNISIVTPDMYQRATYGGSTFPI